MDDKTEAQRRSNILFLDTKLLCGRNCILNWVCQSLTENILSPNAKESGFKLFFLRVEFPYQAGSRHTHCQRRCLQILTRHGFLGDQCPQPLSDTCLCFLPFRDYEEPGSPRLIFSLLLILKKETTTHPEGFCFPVHSYLFCEGSLS